MCNSCNLPRKLSKLFEIESPAVLHVYTGHFNENILLVGNVFFKLRNLFLEDDTHSGRPKTPVTKADMAFVKVEVEQDAR